EVAELPPDSAVSSSAVATRTSRAGSRVNRNSASAPSTSTVGAIQRQWPADFGGAGCRSRSMRSWLIRSDGAVILAILDYVRGGQCTNRSLPTKVPEGTNRGQ